MNNAKLFFMAFVMVCSAGQAVEAAEAAVPKITTLAELQQRLREKVETEAAKPGAPTKQSLMSRFERWIANFSGQDAADVCNVNVNPHGDSHWDVDAYRRGIEERYRPSADN